MSKTILLQAHIHLTLCDCVDDISWAKAVKVCCWIWWLTGDGEGHWLGHQIFLRSSACELGVCVFFLGRILEGRGSSWQSSDGVYQHWGADGNFYTGNKQHKKKPTVKTRGINIRIQFWANNLKKKKDTPFPSANSGLLFFSHVIFAAGFASAATHVASWRGGTKVKAWNSSLTHILHL